MSATPYQFTRVDDLQELNLERCVRSGQVFRWTSVGPDHWEGGDGDTWWRANRRDGFWSIESNCDGAAWDAYFRMDEPGVALRERLSRAGPELIPLFEAHAGHRLLRPSCAREVLFSFVCTANNHLPRITTMVQHLARYGASSDGIPKFPALEDLTGLTEADLRSAGFGYRAAYLVSLVRELRDRGGENWLAELRSADLAALRRELRALPGVGPKVADCVALFGFDRTEVVPVDTHVWHIATEHYFPEWRGLPLNGARYEAVATAFRERFGRDAGWAHQVLFYDRLRKGRQERAGASGST